MNLLSLSCPKQEAALQYSVTLRQSDADKFVVSHYYHPVPEKGYQGGYGNGDYFNELIDAIAEFKDRSDEILDRYRLYPSIMETKPIVPGLSPLFGFKMEDLAGVSYQPIYLIEVNGQINDRPLKSFLVSTETECFSVDKWDRAIDTFSGKIKECLSRVLISSYKIVH